MIGGDVIAITKRSPNQELALKFAEYLMSREIQTRLVTELGWPPIRSDALGSVPEWQQGFFEADHGSAARWPLPAPYHGLVSGG